MGGYGTWEMTAYYNNLFAAAVPICGWWWSEEVEVFKDIPIWMYHGTKDEMESFTSAQFMYNAICATGNQNVQFSALEGVGHNAWDYAAVDREMFKWLFSQRK